MVEVLCVVFVLSSVFRLPLAFTLPLGNVDEAAGDLTGAMVRFFKRSNKLTSTCTSSELIAFVLLKHQLSDFRRQ